MVRNRLKEIRMREYMMDQKQFYTMLDISKSTYSQIENNKQQGNIETVLKIAKALSRPVEEIWFLED
ncbi:helix-turn-helix transcriptional regulator [Clostridium botulinum]|uniref:helix-turn-helix transcriptional regulator n=1 Tax=Clostridium botulinum TaxID=1491 RepID=UPI0013F0E0AA|nr:helix-turn-helix domain-containing protein [Clostridium botulinum]MBY6950367.1 helix-turn-helix domain-containing protein [Clostridium botulinum]MCR1138617.1 helix-turn-helix domain-containing protein [Clostridium botulinum]NEZ80837.1 helix-turn-helix domain-containing protein [Clostridium botulinum]NFA16651.1 helix-turn-helix domain-containing protein [Clostridium botulinum]NFA54778.1 helix-turn-helix domain-containing protein [Clostridium botulinum]